MTPGERYSQDLQQKGFSEDPFQQAIMNRIDALYQSICQTTSSQEKPKRNWIAQLFFPKIVTSQANGLYLWGGVGRGKTYLMDLLFFALPFEQKSRMHFHEFMLDIHQRMHKLAGSHNPLRKIGKELADQYRVLCLDEFQVQDVADAMILTHLLKALFQHGVWILITSNTAPDRLYEKGIQRQSFLPCIALIKEKLEVIHLESGRDFRKQSLDSAGNYLLIHGNVAQIDRQLQLYLQMFSLTEPRAQQTMELNGRPLQVRGISDRVIWCDCRELCEKAHSAADYLVLAQSFSVFLLSDIPKMGEEQDNIAKRFMHLIDLLYDHKKKLIVSAQALPEDLYSGRDLQASFERTASRLVEMSSQQYFASITD